MEYMGNITSDNQSSRRCNIFSTFEGKLAIFAMMGAMLVMLIIFSKFGFVRLLGIGHIIFWVPFLIICSFKISTWRQIDVNFRNWLILVSVINFISLLIDFIDVIRFYKGEREETL
jgi:hypothetical protein